MYPIYSQCIRKGSWLIIAFLMASGYVSSMTAQNDERLEPIINEVLPSQINWSVDSRKVAFNNIALSSQTEEWYVYNLSTDVLTLTDRWPLTPTLLPLEQNILAKVVILDGGQIIPLSKSPDGNYLIYGILSGAEIVTNYGSFPSIQPGVADLRQGTVFTLPELELPGIKNILWSADSSAFMLTQTIAPNVVVNIQYVSNYTTNVADAVLLDWRDGLFIEDTKYAVNGAYDLSADGELALLRINITTSSPSYKMYIYNTNNRNGNFVNDLDATGVIAGSFAPEDESKLWLFNEAGIAQYDLITGEVIILNTIVNTRTATAATINDPAIFSPDGRHLATLGEYGFYIINLTDDLVSSPTTQNLWTVFLPDLWNRFCNLYDILGTV